MKKMKAMNEMKAMRAMQYKKEQRRGIPLMFSFLSSFLVDRPER